MRSTLAIVLFFACLGKIIAQSPTYDRLTLTSSMDQFRFEVPGKNRYWIMSKPVSGYAYALYSPDDSGWFTTWRAGSGNMIMHRGNLGIGISNPSERLEVDGNIRASNLLIRRADITSSEIDNTRTIGLYRVNYSGHSRALLDISGFGGSTPRFQLMAHYADKLYYRAARDGAANWDGKGFREVILANEDGNVGIGTNNPGAFKLAVNGDIRAKEVKVETGWADYVFEPTYNLRSLEEVDTYIKTHKHLPGIPTAEEVEADGVSLGEMNAKLLEKIEELTLYMIEQNKRIEKLEEENESLKE